MAETKEKRRTDAELMALIENSPQEGMVELFQSYAGLVWSVAGKYLDNPEDIKECVNDTFMEFYLHRERFQPAKGELKTWLAAIARNLGVSRYRKNIFRNVEELKEDMALEQDPFGSMEEKVDMERAIEALSEEDAELIRMKYYGGMTVQEIAASLGLPFETVKKRHQRSLKKLKRMLTMGFIIALLAALLAACAYMALRWFGIVPGYGVVTDPEYVIYMLTDPVTAEDYYGTYTVTEAIVVNGVAQIFVEVCFRNDDILKAVEKEEDKDRPEFTYARGMELVEITDMDSFSVRKFQENKTADRYIRYTINDIVLPEDGTLILRRSEMELVIHMKRATVEEQTKYSQVFHEYGGLLAIPQREEDRLLVELYPLNTGEYKFSPSLIRGTYMEGKSEDILLVGEDGRVYVGEQVNTRSELFSAWDFGPVEPGAYILRVPYVFLTAETEREKPDTVLINLKTGQWEEKACQLPFGAVSIISMEPLIPEELPDYVSNIFRLKQSYWRCVLHWEPSAAGLEMHYLPATLECEGRSVSKNYAPEPLPDHCFEIMFGVVLKEDEDTDEALSEARLVPDGTQSIRWDCPYEIPMVVE